MENVWSRPRRAPRQTLTLERIVTEAVALLDEEGVARLTMRRLAERLGTGSTTLYWHVRTKDDVLDLALDAVFGEVPEPARPPGASWREPVRALMGGWRAALLRHPWSATVLDRPLLGPNALARTEFLFQALAAAGLAAPATAAHALSNYVMGSVLMQVTWQDRGGAGSGAFLRERAARYPALAEHGLDPEWDAVFAEGLGHLLAGMEEARRLTTRTPPPA
ncbi:TetR/AcrR family transcriptional regulator C-terminal domain-containing protein [Actinomadura sp. ATCC 31491]|uniref:TetR/AcrR family transcriptional regulator C-terminal domain-containing protein n=1 Tax=Actinomadura luzonensis TaxID=2805427 RepID=A0ABT0FUJ0_9ACTN|nr:TetR/AcrR family transcriptional regulator C-terminal domain-containing protein [Actinomadura luzonensis]MCK2216008.1 TetR/AcrR family transcriptional regulator C-terminal domain-containing protein [Actinomadura luzonensis]